MSKPSKQVHEHWNNEDSKQHPEDVSRSILAIEEHHAQNSHHVIKEKDLEHETQVDVYVEIAQLLPAQQRK